MSLLSDIKYKGFIRETEYNEGDPLSIIKKDEIIIYGRKGENIYFIYLKERGNPYFIRINNIGDIISCKFIRGSRYVCAYFQNNKICVSIIYRKIISSSYRLEIFSNIEIDDSKDYDILILYDTDEQFYKILCYSNKKNNKPKCIAIYCELWHHFERHNNYVDGELKKLILEENYSVSLSKLHNCYLNEFNNEFLLCCGNNNIINCQRNNINKFNLIDHFSIGLSGEITNIILENKKDHLIISYKNQTSSKNYLYKYYIYPPKCKNVSMRINSFQKSEISLSELFENKTNTKYYIRFHYLPASIQIISIGDERINSHNYKFQIKSEKEKLYFIYNSYEAKKNYDIIYNISIDETYSSTCKISLTINECYYSCKGCYYDINNSNSTNHNCINCKEEYNYFPYSEKLNNCYNEQEIK